jgi:hypothetical protein
MRAVSPAIPALVAIGFFAVNSACNPCGPPCDSTVHPYPIQSSEYAPIYGNPSCYEQLEDGGTTPDGGPQSDGGEMSDAGEAVDGGGDPSTGDPVCDHVVRVDADAGVVTHEFTYRRQRHIVRYRRTSVETISKDVWQESFRRFPE